MARETEGLCSVSDGTSDILMTIKVELFTANFCPRCRGAKTALEGAIKALGREQFELRLLDVVEEIDHAVALGVLATPAIAVDGALVHAARPTVDRFKIILRDRLASVKVIRT